MKTIKVSDPTYRAIEDLSVGEFKSTGTRQPDGTWLVPISDELGARLSRLGLPGETHDDTVARLISFYRRQSLN